MDEVSSCSTCHVAVKQADYFCYNCGKNLHPKPLGTSPVTLGKICLGSVFLAPMGLFWGIRYLREKDQKSKIVGIIAIVLTVLVLFMAMQYTVKFINNVNNQVGKQLQGIEEF